MKTKYTILTQMKCGETVSTYLIFKRSSHIEKYTDSFLGVFDKISIMLVVLSLVYKSDQDQEYMEILKF
jgi:hypothetical protein